jgi:hypothetical protein
VITEFSNKGVLITEFSSLVQVTIGMSAVVGAKVVKKVTGATVGAAVVGSRVAATVVGASVVIMVVGANVAGGIVVITVVGAEVTNTVVGAIVVTIVVGAAVVTSAGHPELKVKLSALHVTVGKGLQLLATRTKCASLLFMIKAVLSSVHEEPFQ